MIGIDKKHVTRQSIPPRGSGWVQLAIGASFFRPTNPLPRGGTDCIWMMESGIKDHPVGPILALDLGQKRVGAAVSDSRLISITKLPVLTRSNWKRLLNDVTELARRFDARSLVIGLPLSLDGTEGSAALEARRTAKKFALSLGMPVYLQDERLTSAEAEDQLRAAGYAPSEIPGLVDGQSAAIILADFMAADQQRILVSQT